MSYLIVFPTELEAQCLLANLSVTKEAENLYSFEQGKILITGMGVLNSLAALYQVPITFKEVWGVGIAGALNPKFALGSIYCINKVGKLSPTLSDTSSHGIELFSELHPDFAMQPVSLLPRANLVSTDFPIYNKSMVERLAPTWDLVDMESYALAYYCHDKGLIYKGLKVVSDFANPGGEQSIQEQIHTLSNELSKNLLSLLLL
jgi:nucleoside phosphorylase